MNERTGFIRNLREENLVDQVARISPWLAPFIPASFAYHNIIDQLGSGDLTAVVAAASIEFLGLAAVHTSLTLWDYNRMKRETDPGLPTWVTVVAWAFYLATVVTTNILLDWGQDLNPAHIAAKALLSLISVPAAIVLAVRSQYKRINKRRDDDTLIASLRGKLGAATRENNELQSRFDSVAAETEQLRKANKMLQKQADEKQKLEQYVATLEARIEEMKRPVTLETLPVWQKLNGTAQATLMYIDGRYSSMDEAAKAVDTNKTAVYRLNKQLNGAGDG